MLPGVKMRTLREDLLDLPPWERGLPATCPCCQPWEATWQGCQTWHLLTSTLGVSGR